MSYTFHAAYDNFATTVAAPRSSGASTVTLSDASKLTSFPVYLSFARGQDGPTQTQLTILEAVSKSGNVITVSGPVGTWADAALLVGDVVEVRPTAESVMELQTAINSIQIAVGASLASSTPQGVLYVDSGGHLAEDPTNLYYNSTNHTLVTPGIKVSGSPTNGYVLTSDVNGVGTWQAPRVAVGGSLTGGSAGRVLYDAGGTVGESAGLATDGNRLTIQSTSLDANFDNALVIHNTSGVVGKYSSIVFESNGNSSAYIRALRDNAGTGYDTELIFGTATTAALGTPAERMRIASGGGVGINTGSTTIGAQLHVVSPAATTVGEIVQLAASQTADALQVNDSNGNVLAKIDKFGLGTFGGLSAPGTGGASERFGSGASTGTYFSSTAIGANATTSSNLSVAVGASASAASGSVALGASAHAPDGTVAIGYNTSTGVNSTAVGGAAAAGAAAGYSTTVGFNAAADYSSVAYGYGATATGLVTIAIGTLASAPYQASIAIGGQAAATQANQLAIGSTSYPVNQVVFPGSSPRFTLDGPTRSFLIDLAASQTADALQVKNSGGTVLAHIDSAGTVITPRIGIGTATPATDLHISTPGTSAAIRTDIPLVLGNYGEWQFGYVGGSPLGGMRFTLAPSGGGATTLSFYTWNGFAQVERIGVHEVWGGVCINTSTAGAQFHITTGGANIPGQIIDLSAGQFTPALQVRDSNHNVLAFIDQTGTISSGNGNHSERFGAGASVSTSINSTAIGDSAVAGSSIFNNSVAIGHAANAAQEQATAIGASATCTQSYSVAIGFGASAASGSVAIGVGVSATASTIAIGYSSFSGNASTALGYGAAAGGGTGLSVAVGTSATASNNGVAIGWNGSCSGMDSVAIGLLTNVSHATAIGLGRAATSSATNQLVLGGSAASGYPINMITLPGATPLSPSTVPNNTLFLDSTNSNKLSWKDSSGTTNPLY